MIKETLRSLCCSNGWCYGIFWGFDQRNSLLLTLKDDYYEEQMGALIDSMLLQRHVLGGGVIGQAAFTKSHHWMYSDAYQERQNSLGSFESLEVLQDDSEFYCQFSIGIKTIALISVEPWGVVQLGSTQKIPETKDFVDQVKELFREMDRCQETKFSENEPPSESQFCDPSMQFSSLLSCGVPQSANRNLKRGAEDEGFIEENRSFVLPSQSFHSDQSRNSLFTASGLIENQIQISRKPTSELEQLLLESGNFFDFSATQALSSHSDCSVLTSSWPHSTSALNENVSLPRPRSYESCRNSSSNAPVNPVFTSLQVQQFSNDTQSFSSLVDPTDCKAKRPSMGLLTLEELIQENNFAETISKPGLMDDLSQWFSPQPGSSGNPFTTLLSNDLSHVTGLVPASSLSRNSSAIQISDNLPANSIQSSLTDAFTSNHEVKASNMFGIEKPFNSLGVESGCKKPLGWNETLIPVVNSNDLSFCTDVSSCISEKYVGSNIRSSNSLFSKLGLDQLLDGISSSSSFSFVKSRFEGQSAKRRKIDNSSWCHDDVKTQVIPSFDGKMKLMDPVYGPAISNIELNSEASKKIAGACISDGRTSSAGNSISSKGQDEPSKTGKKKAKPGTRPRPKDRQMIQDRLSELRELIPNGEKMSIDRLLERTIRHLNFMQSLTKHAESLKQIDKLKSREARKNHASNDGGGATWACEVEDQTICPLMVEDLRTPGQMLIEILCEEQGFFLEIVDVIRGFGLTILKGVMEVRETNIWANFVVEGEKGTRPVTRHEIFSSLIQLLQMTGQDATNASDSIGNAIGSATPLFNNCQQAVSFPVNLADTLQCANL
ncbi:Transcription factor LHW [Sesamum alatum]|uniref:Transcription factor LHW n=1 Tax=Sesamum alatum TaxID=300844 RepID=A0AAE2CI82_9LAMI|nr:Transcription factor LHW [Sesamum alatum]